MTTCSPLRVAVLISGGGRSLANLLAHRDAGTLPLAVVAVVSSVPDAGGLAIAAAHAIPTAIVTRRSYATDAAYTAAVLSVLRPYQPELILLAGFLRRLVVGPGWERRMLNIHPALLPESGAAGRGYYGERVHAAVLAAGATISGATVHVVDDGYDTGPVVLRREVPVLPGDTPATLAARVFTAECELYPAAIRQHVTAHPELFGAHRLGGDNGAAHGEP